MSIPKYFYMMVGTPGSGKSTWIKDNIFDRSIVVASSDNFIDDRAKEAGLTYNEVFEDVIEEANKAFFKTVTNAVKDGKNLLVDRTNMSKKSRKKILAMIPDGYIKVAIVVACSDDFVLANRLANRPGKSIPPHILNAMKNSYQEPSEDEGFKTILFIETAPEMEEA